MVGKPSLLIFLFFIFSIGTGLIFFNLKTEKLRGPASKEEIFSDNYSKELKEKTLLLFKNNSFADEISDFVVIGNFFEGTSEYGKIYLKNLENLNQNPFLIFFAIREKIQKISPEDFFIRERLLVLVDRLDIPSERKAEFFGEQIIRKVEFDFEGYLTDDSKNIIQAMTFFGQNASKEEEILKYANSVLILNQDNKKAVDQLISRFKIYFPRATKDLQRPQLTNK